MGHIQKSLLDYIDIPCAMITSIDGEDRSPPIHLTKDDLDRLLWRNRDEWETITLHYLDHTGEPRPGGVVEMRRDDVFGGNHFLL